MTTITTHPLTSFYFRSLADLTGTDVDTVFAMWAADEIKLSGQRAADRIEVLTHFPADACRDYRNN